MEDSDWLHKRLPKPTVRIATGNCLALGFVTGLTLDGGLFFRLFLMALLTQLALIVLLLVRRRGQLTKLDRFLIQYAIVPIFAVFVGLQYCL